MSARSDASLAVAAVACALLAGCAGRLQPAAPSAGYVDFARVRAESSLGRMLDDGHAQVARAKQAEADKTGQQLAEAEKRKDKELAAERQQAAAHIQQLQADVNQDEAQVEARLLRSVQPVAAAVARERHLASVDIAPAGRLWSADDLTDEVVRRLDAQSGPQIPPRK